MRNAFAAEMVELAQKYPELVLLTGDMGNRLFDEYKKLFSDRFYNCGVAEANMTSVAAGMAACGLKPVTYSIASFNTLRCFEQIKIDICYHKLSVIVVGVGAGLSYAELGPTHQSCEDMAIMRSLPGMTVICPGDAVEVKLALKAAVELGRPVYLRLGKKNEPVVHKIIPDFKIGKGIVLKTGRDICLIGTGNVLPLVIKTGALLDKLGFSVAVISMHTVKPLDISLLNSIIDQYSLFVTIEEHSMIGGLGSAVVGWLNQQLICKKILSIGCDDAFFCLSNGQFMAREKNTIPLTSEHIAFCCAKIWDEKSIMVPKI